MSMYYKSSDAVCKELVWNILKVFLKISFKSSCHTNVIFNFYIRNFTKKQKRFSDSQTWQRLRVEMSLFVFAIWNTKSQNQILSEH